MKFVCLFLLFFLTSNLDSQSIPDDRVISPDELSEFLKAEVQSKLTEEADLTHTTLAAYFRTQFSKRFFYDYRSLDDRQSHYRNQYQNESDHKTRALEHMGKYADSTRWLLPFNYLNGDPVDAYALRHLARQHKMVDIAMLYFQEDRDPKYIRYFENQMRSLNAALHAGQYDRIEDGNGVYEVFRSGYRILNWLWIHNMFLNETEYSDRDQLYTIATLLQHGQHLYERNAQFRAGNHQTRGMSALALISILLSDFEGTDQWFNLAIQRLGEHLEKEINPDGFQFERSVHYHMSDINNYFYVYQLARVNQIDVRQEWEAKLRGLFTSLVKIAYPDRSAPVLQDDTEIPWGEKNDISGAMTLGYLLFEDPEFGYFASNKVDDRMYWYLSQQQVELLKDIQSRKPNYGSLAFEDTHYYIMREGWNQSDKMMIVSAGLDPDKPDHQHGDMLGIQAMAYGHVILPNYQVRYSLPDFNLFKNSMVKNVALVDDEMQGKQWTSNKGGSGFGKFKELPNPKVLSWKTNSDFDFFAGSHDGFENVGVNYSRQVIYVKDDFWIVKDNFSSNEVHSYKQVWQGHYTTEEGPNLIRSTFDNACGLDIIQLNAIDSTFSNGRRGKQWTIVSKNGQTDFSFITVLFPYRGYHNRFDESGGTNRFNDWIVNHSEETSASNFSVSLINETEGYYFNTDEVEFEQFRITSSKLIDLFVEVQYERLRVHYLGTSPVSITIKAPQSEPTMHRLMPGEEVVLE